MIFFISPKSNNHSSAWLQSTLEKVPVSPPIQSPQFASQALLGQAETGEEWDGGLVMSDSSLGPSLWIQQEPAHLPWLWCSQTCARALLPGDGCSGCLSPCGVLRFVPYPTLLWKLRDVLSSYLLSPPCTCSQKCGIFFPHKR